MTKSNNRYPSIHIRSKNELAKHISSTGLSKKRALALINDVLENHDKYWKDHPKQSQPKKGKWVRDASRTNLGKLLKLIDKRVLSPNDKMLPNFIFGGVSNKNHKAAVKQLLGKKRKRKMLKLDITKFYEQINYDRVYSFFKNKCNCSAKGAKLLADICCVHYGPKENPADYKTIARGFSTSSRLAVWCNLDTLLRLDWLVKKELKGKDPRVAIYVDDIGITASSVTKEELMSLHKQIEDVLNSDKKQQLPLNHSKTKIVFHSGETYNISGNLVGRWGFEHLGIQMNRNSLTPGTKTRWKLVNLKEKVKNSQAGKSDYLKEKRSRRSLMRYKRYIEDSEK